MLSVITVATGVERGLGAFLASCRRQGIEPIVLGMGEPWRGLGWRLKRLRRALDDLPAGGVVLAADAYDSILVHGATTILGTFARLGHPFVIAAETNCWPDADKAPAYPPVASRYRFVNGGGWIAKAGHARTLLDRLGVGRLGDDANDQRFLADAYLADPSIFRLDTRCEVFQTLWMAGDDLVCWRDGICNRATGTYPSVFHGNGKLDMREVLAWAGLLDAEAPPSPAAPAAVETAPRRAEGPRASVVIAAHNEGDNLWRTVQSCLETAADLDCEIIVADDASMDDSVAELLRRYPQVRVVAHAERRGTSPTKDLGARAARGGVLVFLDAHCKPEPGALARLVADVEALEGRAIVTPSVPALDVWRWENHPGWAGHGFGVELETFDCRWVDLDDLRVSAAAGAAGATLYESPSLIACCAAMGRVTYEALWGFDPGLLTWGLEDMDLGLKAWRLGYPVLHDPAAVVGHRFRAGSGYEAPAEHLPANKLRIARKHFGDATWGEWVERGRPRHPGPLWDRAWALFEAGRDSLERERVYLRTQRVRDEHWYAGRFGLAWPAAMPWIDEEGRLVIGQADSSRELFLEHYRRPRNWGLLSDADAVGTVESADGARLTLYLRMGSGDSSGGTQIERATFRGEMCGAAVAFASLLTELIQGQKPDRARQLCPDDLMMRLGARHGVSAPAELVIAALQKSLGQITGSSARLRNNR
jgi:GT2 family glycosyltransferase/NifU-like protein involved in Fe-S cluster formation